jgi:Tfp pilus assembly protein PilF
MSSPHQHKTGMFRNLLFMFRISRAIGRNDHHLVVELSEKALKKDPNNIPALSFAASHSYSLGDYTAARKFAERALSIDPSQTDLHLILVKIFQYNDDHEGMLEQAKWILAIDETNTDALDPNMVKTVHKLERIIPSGSSIPKASQVLIDGELHRAECVAWAKEYIQYRNDRQA